MLLSEYMFCVRYALALRTHLCVCVCVSFRECCVFSFFLLYVCGCVFLWVCGWWLFILFRMFWKYTRWDVGCVDFSIVCWCMLRMHLCIYVWILVRYVCVRRSPHSVVANMLNCNLKVSEFDLWSRYYVHFRTNTLGKVMNPHFSQLGVKLYQSRSSKRMALALNKPQRLICH